MPPVTRRFAIVAASAVALVATSTAAQNIDPPPIFTVSPLDPAIIRVILPLGSMSPAEGGHVLPSDHIYLNWRDRPDSPFQSLPIVLAPAPGTITAIQRAQGAPDARITVQVSRTFFYYLAHVEPDPALAVGMMLAPGQRVGTGTSRTVGIDLGVVNMEVSNQWASPRRYPLESRFGDSPFKYFAEPLRTTLRGKSERPGRADGPGRDGAFNYDKVGTLAGNWWLTGAPDDEMAQAPQWAPYQLAFAYDRSTPGVVRVSVGGRLSVGAGLFGVQPLAPDPASVTPASGIIAYQLQWWPLRTGPLPGLMLVQMLDDRRVRIETFPGSSARTGTFTAAALIYERGPEGPPLAPRPGPPAPGVEPR